MPRRLGGGPLAGPAVAAAYSAAGVTIVGEGPEPDVNVIVNVNVIGGARAGVLLPWVIQNVIDQVGTLSSPYQSVVSGALPSRAHPRDGGDRLPGFAH